MLVDTKKLKVYDSIVDIRALEKSASLKMGTFQDSVNFLVGEKGDQIWDYCLLSTQQR